MPCANGKGVSKKCVVGAIALGARAARPRWNVGITSAFVGGAGGAGRLRRRAACAPGSGGNFQQGFSLHFFSNLKRNESQ